MIGAEVRDSCRSSRTGETLQAFTPRAHLSRGKRASGGESTTPHYLVNSNKVCENSQIKKPVLLRRLAFFHLKNPTFRFQPLQKLEQVGICLMYPFLGW
ncbi:hypothetical protein KEH51_15900 [[Brevibacterium] frigoritolerans]|uniref:Uncharacterized protein n=1 Tax=Peribacillus frigoritolerans TaxID=450367 RepID=A0A941J714_9BACI|nr:hypothetical protein [Peribacillus frigoritolerans]